MPLVPQLHNHVAVTGFRLAPAAEYCILRQSHNRRPHFRPRLRVVPESPDRVLARGDDDHAGHIRPNGVHVSQGILTRSDNPPRWPAPAIIRVRFLLTVDYPHWPMISGDAGGNRTRVVRMRAGIPTTGRRRQILENGGDTEN